ncbi:MAG: TauD/TfdA family dioxygenase [Betaproteobacteria bacterium]|nr:TauD/TfdA family dioxygenase [Betaproteobacteria bacterium]
MPPASEAAAAAPARTPPRGPFAPADAAAYQAWRAAKLAAYPASLDELSVPVRDPRALTADEHAALARAVARANMAVYASADTAEDRDLPRLLAHQFALTRLDHNWLADDDGISSVTVTGESGRGEFIPYTNKPIRWHTDGYYNPPARRIRAMVLHCVRPAASGGENALLDHEIAYILVRDADPALAAALMRPDAMTIPERADADGVARPAETGPVFSVDPETGALHMRYTARTRSIEWNADPDVRAAAECLTRVLAGPSPYIHRVTLAAGMGLLCNNVLHDRTGFTDDPARPRLIYRARYYDRIRTHT